MSNSSTQWVKIGNIKNLPAIPQKAYDCPIIVGSGNSHDDFQPEDGSGFWFKRTHSTILTLTHDMVTEYLRGLDLPFFPVETSTFLSMTETLGWHRDSNRVTTLNVALVNGPSGRVEFEDGTSYHMQQGDVYCLDVTKRHRIVIEEGAVIPRVILNICLEHGFNTSETQQIIKNIKDHLIGR